MQRRLMRFVEEVRASFWFLPTVLATVAILLSVATISLDQTGTSSWLDRIGFIYLNQPGGARLLLSTIAGSMISVAGVVFSLTIIALTLASQQFGPRLLGNFMRDRGNQLVLGIFIATFLYCLLVLRTVKSAANGSNPFVPHLSVTVALLLTLITLAATIYFIHHIAQSIQVHTLIQKVSSEMLKQIGAGGKQDLFPSRLGLSAEGRVALPEDFGSRSATVLATESGYFQSVDGSGLMKLAQRDDVVIRLLERPGQFVLVGQEIARVYPADRADEVGGTLHKLLSFGSARTKVQDVESLFDQLLELALRSLSPASADPVTATHCIDRMAEGLIHMDQRTRPTEMRLDEEGELRVVVPPLEVAGLAKRLFSTLRTPVSADLLAATHMVATLRKLRRLSSDGSLSGVVQQEANALLAQCKETMYAADYRSLLQQLESGAL